MKRIHFTDRDLRNVRVEASYGPLAETALSLERLMRRDWSAVPAGAVGPGEAVGFEGWRERVAGRAAPAERALAQLLPRALDLVTMTGRATSIDEGLEAVVAVPPALFEVELSSSAMGPFRPPAWAAPLTGRAPGARAQLAGALGAYHRTALAPHWPAVARLLEAERERAARRLGEQGIDRFLSSLHPTIRWDPPVLSIDSCLPTADQEARLDGRGVVFVPSLFCPPGYPMCASPAHPDASPVIHYPVAPDVTTMHRLWNGGGAGDGGRAAARSSLRALLGRTRAAVLDAVADGPCTTTELARRAGVSVPSASEHAAVLRRAGLVGTRREGRAVRHTVTPLGARLLEPPADGGW